ncbi:transporter, partial [Arthrospira platensis SPKY1]|nr:transporter [Arthrospira platensis SPKY1]
YDRTITLPTGNTVTIKSDGKADITALALVKVIQGSNANERLAFTAILPYSRLETNLTTQPSPAALAGSLPPPLATALIGELNKRNGKTQGIGDLELNASWLRAEGPWKFRVASSLVLPTG